MITQIIDIYYLSSIFKCVYHVLYYTIHLYTYILSQACLKNTNNIHAISTRTNSFISNLQKPLKFKNYIIMREINIFQMDLTTFTHTLPVYFHTPVVQPDRITPFPSIYVQIKISITNTAQRAQLDSVIVDNRPLLTALKRQNELRNTILNDDRHFNSSSELLQAVAQLFLRPKIQDIVWIIICFRNGYKGASWECFNSTISCV